MRRGWMPAACSPAKPAAAGSRPQASAHTGWQHLPAAESRKPCKGQAVLEELAGPLLTRCCVQVCNVTCCGLPNFEQHCASKRHLRKLAVAGLGAVEGGPASSGSSPQVGSAGLSSCPTRKHTCPAALHVPVQHVQRLSHGPGHAFRPTSQRSSGGCVLRPQWPLVAPQNCCTRQSSRANTGSSCKAHGRLTCCI